MFLCVRAVDHLGDFLEEGGRAEHIGEMTWECFTKLVSPQGVGRNRDASQRVKTVGVGLQAGGLQKLSP